MAETPKFSTPEFVFKKVTTYPYYLTYFLSLLAAVPSVLFFYYGIYGHFQHGGLAVCFGVFILLLILGMKAFSKTVIIYLDRSAVYISGEDRKFKTYPFRHIRSIYSYNYDQRNNNKISILIILTNGKKIYLNDASPFPLHDMERVQSAKAFLSAAKKRMGLSEQGKNRWRSIQGLGAHRYTRNK